MVDLPHPPGKVVAVDEPGIGTVDVAENEVAGEQLPEGSIELPSGAIILNAPKGLLEFLVGTIGGESGGNYFAKNPGDAGYGAYQFSGGSLSADASKANWSPYAQDVVAADQAIEYYHAFGGASNPKVWQEVSQAWWGGPKASFIGETGEITVQTDEGPETVDVSPDWPSIEEAQKGGLSFGNFQYGKGYKGGLTPLEVVYELQGQKATATGAAGKSGGTTSEPASSTGSQLASIGSGLGSGLESAVVTDARNVLEMLGGVALIALGVWMIFKDLSGTSVGRDVGSATAALRRRSARQAAAESKKTEEEIAERRQYTRDRAKLRSIQGGRTERPYSEPFEGPNPPLRKVTVRGEQTVA